jgi:hypothetical protein
MHIKFSSENLEIRDHSEYLRINGRIILEWILNKRGMGCQVKATLAPRNDK